ncbi:Strictosidine synthase, conserved region [Sesbania bispinosa]|nr:Strictosidine synthase, conserved region [Sesbania bispinosa]
MTLARGFAIVFLLFALYCGLDPFQHSPIANFPDFEAKKVDMPAWSQVPTDQDKENLLQKSEIKFLNQVQGPESIAFDPLGRGPYTGLADGRILFWNGQSWVDFAYTSPNRSELCNPIASATPFSYVRTEHICGRPLGLRFDKKTGDLYIADAYFGLMKVGPEGGTATSLATEAEGVPLRFTNDVDIDTEGNVYFTESSANYPRRNFIQLVFSGDDSGKVLKYNPATKETTVLVRNVQFPNGISLSKDGSFFVFCEGAIGRLRKYWLKGDKAGTSEVLAILPGFPDNVRVNENGDFWVAIHCRRYMYSYLNGLYPKIRKVILKLPIPTKYQYLLQIGGWQHAVIVKYSPEGKLLQILEDSQGKVVRAVSEVEEKDVTSVLETQMSYLVVPRNTSDIRKWFMKSHDKGNNAGVSKPSSQPKPSPDKPNPEKNGAWRSRSSGRRKTSKYFNTDKQKPKDEKETLELPAKRKNMKDNEELLEPCDDGDDSVLPAHKKKLAESTPTKKLKSGSGVVVEEEHRPNQLVGEAEGGGGRGGFMNFGERKDPPHKGEKEVPEGAPNCLNGLTFVISGTLDSLEREEAEDLIKRHGGRVTGSISKKTNYLLCDEDIGGRKSSKAKELGTSFLTEDRLFDMIRASKPAKAQEECKKSANKAVAVASQSKVLQKWKQRQLLELSCYNQGCLFIYVLSCIPLSTNAVSISSRSPSNQTKRKTATTAQSSLMWTEKHRPTDPKNIIGNQSLVSQLRNWLKLGMGNFWTLEKTTSAKLVCQELGFQAIEVNASDSRGKADSKIEKGISGSNSNSIKELVTNEALSTDMDRSKHSKTVLIMDEVDGMSAGDRGGIADLIASIKISKIPIICICNDRYSQKLKSLVNYCLLLSFRKPTKQQMAKKLMDVAKAEGLQVNEIALEELAERVNGDMRMALNQLHYMSLSMSVINYDDIRQRFLTNAKDEDISPFTAVDKIFGFNGGKLKMDERISLSMSDPDLVPLLIQCYKRMNLIARAAESIADGDIVNVQIRRYRQWQLSQTSSVASCIIPASLLHGQREILEQGERNFNRFGGWLGKNSTMGKNMRLLDDLHVHILASRESSSGRDTIRLEYLTLLLRQLTEPLRVLPKVEAVQKVVEFMNTYSISQEDFDTIVELSKFKGHPNPLDGIQPAVKSALTKAYKEQSKSRMVRAADLVTLPGIKKVPKKRIAAILEPADEGVEQGDGDTLGESEEENTSDTEDLEGTTTGEKLKSELQSLNSKAMQVQLELKGTGNSSSKKTSGGRGKGASASVQKDAQTSRATAKRKR